MPELTVVEDGEPTPATCWCCGSLNDPERMVHLGNHPEVALCLGCARWTAKEASEIEARDRAGPLVLARDRFRSIRRRVVDRGLHRHPVIGRPLRWIGRHLP
jgi:hypothetical protein